jgi:hypothetical protein
MLKFLFGKRDPSGDWHTILTFTPESRLAEKLTKSKNGWTGSSRRLRRKPLRELLRALALQRKTGSVLCVFSRHRMYGLQHVSLSVLSTGRQLYLA